MVYGRVKRPSSQFAVAEETVLNLFESDVVAGEDRADREARTAELLDRVAELEDRLDPEPLQRGQRIADLVTLAVLTPLILWVGEGLRYPLLLLALLLGARSLSRLIPYLRNRQIRDDRDRMLETTRPIEVISTAQAAPRAAGPSAKARLVSE